MGQGVQRQEVGLGRVPGEQGHYAHQQQGNQRGHAEHQGQACRAQDAAMLHGKHRQQDQQADGEGRIDP
ncbi:hypothetical protein D3C87_2042290 [compost metagenome]